MIRAIALSLLCAACATSPDTIELARDDATGTLAVSIAERPAFDYRYGPEFAIPHVYPLRAPSGRSLLVQQTEPYPHHRALWVADRVQLAGGRDVDFYHCWKNLRDPEHPELGYRCLIRTDAVSPEDDDSFTVRSTWIVDEDAPVLDDVRHFQVRDLGDGEYLIDLRFQLRAAYGDVTFRSDTVHYAWPYLRMEPAMSADSGGVLIDDQGRIGQKATNGQVAKWVDYSNTLDGVTEGVGVFVFPDGEDHEWLTRDYGTFGPRRASELSGTRFTLPRGQAIGGRVGILVHRGDATTGHVAERYRDYVGTP